MNISTACSFAADSTPVIVPAARPAPYARSMAGYLARSGALNVRLLALVKSRRGQVASETMMRSGNDMVCMMGRRMSGHPSCAITDESAVSTIEWMMDCGWMTMSMLS
eukprot:364463-Chlamydomonas_euryale.AAC.4